MKKQTKLLALVLSFALIFCAVAVIASAAASDQLDMSKKSDKIVNVENESFEGTNFQKDVISGGMEENANPATLPGNSIGFGGASNRHGHFYSKTVGGNTYLNFWHVNDGTGVGAQTTSNSYLSTYMNVKYNKYLEAYDYLTFDADIGAEKYLDAGKLTDTNTGKASYMNNGQWEFRFYANKAAEATFRIVFSWNAGKGQWQVSLGGGTGSGLLAKDANVWNHVTVVVDLDKVPLDANGAVISDGSEPSFYDYSGTKVYLYLDGVCVSTHSSAFTSANFKKAAPGSYAYEGRFISRGGEYASNEFSVMFDNWSTNYYSKGYDGELASFALGSDASLLSLDDVVYNGKYQCPAPTASLAEVKIGDVTAPYFFKEGLETLGSLADGCTLTVKAGQTLEGFNPHAAGIVEGFMVVLEEGASFSLLDDCGFVFDGDEVKVASADDTIKLTYWTDYDSIPGDIVGDEEALLGEGTLTFGTAPVVPAFGADKINYLQFVRNTAEGAVYKVVSGWEWSWYNGNDDEVKEPLGAVTDQALFNEMRDNNRDFGIVVYPVFEEKTIAFELLDANGVFVDTNGVAIKDGGDYALFLDEANFASVANYCASNSMTVKVQKNIVYGGAAADVIIVNEGNSIAIDLNGYRITYQQPLDGKKNFIQLVSDNSKAERTGVTIYSSREGGMIVYAGTYSASGNIYKGGNALISAYLPGVDLQLGAYKNDAMGVDAAGDNLSIYCPMIIDCTSSNNGVANTIVSNIIIDGGKYVRDSAYANALFTVRNTINFVAKNADLIVATGNPIFYASGYDYPKCIATIDNCRLIGMENQYIIRETGVDSEFTITNSVVLGQIWATDKVILGENVQLGSKVDLTGANVTVNGIVIPVSNEEVTENIPHFKYPYDSSNTVIFESAPTDRNFKYTITQTVISGEDAFRASAKINLDTTNGFFFNLYIPESLGAKVYSDPALATLIAGISAGDVGIKYTAAAVSPAFTGTVTFYVTLEGVADAIPVEVSLADYFERVLALDGVTETEKKLIVTAANYCNAVYTLVNGTGTDAFDAVLTTDNVNTYAKVDANALALDAENANIANLATVISGASVVIGEGNIPVFAFNMVADGDLEVSVYSLSAASTVKYNAVKSGEYYLTDAGFGVYNAAADITLTAGGVSGTYNLAAYIVSAEEGAARDVASALYLYSLASLEYVTAE